MKLTPSIRITTLPDEHRQFLDIATGTFNLRKPVFLRYCSSSITDRKYWNIATRRQRSKRSHTVGGSEKNDLDAGKIDSNVS